MQTPMVWHSALQHDNKKPAKQSAKVKVGTTQVGEQGRPVMHPLVLTQSAAYREVDANRMTRQHTPGKWPPTYEYNTLGINIMTVPYSYRYKKVIIFKSILP